ncbi:MAG: tetratricopeptide repeat protein [Ruminococcaceae bacterium]|nr:tetratricopeptide repeat protein [Oscillospiraceae bacterium]
MIDLNRLCLGCMNELEEENKTCKICGWDNEADENSPHQLKCGTVLQGKYLVGKVLGEGGFGITYLGYNLIIQEKVAIKEFYPHGYVGRDATVNSTVLSYVGQEAFTEKAKDGFIREAKTMQSLNNVEGIVEMKDVFSENQTVYIVMRYVEGQTLKEYVKENGNKLPMSTVLKLLEPVMNALEQVHAHNLIHRDISPDNIMVSSDGRVTLLDLGAARQISADGGHSLTVNVKHGYAPVEQYQTHGEQGPWTDIYALCATIYRLITGKVPPSAADRALEDNIVKPSALGANISKEQERVLLKGLAVRSEERFLNVFELKEAFNSGKGDNKLKEEINSENTTDSIIENEKILVTESEKVVNKAKRLKKIAIALIVLVLIIIASVLIPKIIKENKIEENYISAIGSMESGNYDDAIIKFEAMIELDPNVEEAYIGLFEAYSAMEDYDKAGEWLYAGYIQTEDENMWELLKEFENTKIKVSHKSGYYENGLKLSFTSGKGTDIYYNIGMESEPTKKYTKPLALDDGLYHIVVQAKGKYTGAISEIYEFEYIAGPVPKSMEVVEKFGFQGKKYSYIGGMVDGKIAVQSRETDLWGIVDTDFNEIAPMEAKTFFYSSGEFLNKKRKKSIEITVEYINGKDYICWLGKPISDLEIERHKTLSRWMIDEGYWEKIIPFATPDGKFGVMNILGEIIVEPQYEGMVNADNDMIIAVGKEGTVRLEARYES